MTQDETGEMAEMKSVDTIFTALSTARNRVVFRTFAERRPEYDAWSEMALPRGEFVARFASERDVTTDDAHTAMHHITFPELEDKGFVTCNDDGTVVPADLAAIRTATRVLNAMDDGLREQYQYDSEGDR